MKDVIVIFEIQTFKCNFNLFKSLCFSLLDDAIQEPS